jgi:polyisoprenoid-binding protein YceI
MAITTWDLDPAHSSITFHARHLMVSRVYGQFATWSGSLDIDDDDPAKSHISIQIHAASIDTHDTCRDQHLRSHDFLDVTTYPSITFVSTSVADVGDRWAVTGNLTLHGVTRAVVLAVDSTPEVKDPWGNTRRGFSATATVSRRDFGLTWNVPLDAGGVLLGDRVDIDIDLEGIKEEVSRAA